MKAFTHVLLFCTLSILFGNAVARSKKKMPVQPIKLYSFVASPPSRAVRMTANVLGLDVELIETNIMKGEQMTEEFLKMNPQHTVPTIDDNGFYLYESRAIMAYFVNAYGRDDSLYPKNPRLRAVVDQRLYFDTTLFTRFRNLYGPMFQGAPFNEENGKKLSEALGWLNTFLDGKPFVAGDNFTIADISIIVTITNLNALEFDLSEFDNVKNWFERAKKVLEPHGYADIDEAAAKILASFVNKN